MNNNSGLTISILHRRLGLTLLEVLVVIVILALLAGVLAVNYGGTLASAKQKIARQEMVKLRDLLEQYYFETGSYPTQEEGLAALTRPLPGREEPLATGRLTDPWGNAYIYIYPGMTAKYDLISLGADGLEGGEGDNADINLWQMQSGEDGFPK